MDDMGAIGEELSGDFTYRPWVPRAICQVSWYGISAQMQSGRGVLNGTVSRWSARSFRVDCVSLWKSGNR